MDFWICFHLFLQESCRFSRVLDCSIGIFFFMSDIHLLVNTYYIFLGSLTHDVFSRPVHLSTNFRMSYISYNWVVLHWVNVSHFCILSSVDGHQVCFQVLSNMNYVSMNIVEKATMWYNWASIGHIPSHTCVVSWICIKILWDRRSQKFLTTYT